MNEAADIRRARCLGGKSLKLYNPAERTAVAPGPGKIPGVTGVILAGGASLRMQSDKSLLPLQGARFIDHVHGALDELFEEILIVTNCPACEMQLSHTVRKMDETLKVIDILHLLDGALQ